MTIWVDVQQHRRFGVGFDCIASAEFDDIADADIYARRWVDGGLGIYAVVSDGKGILYRVGNDRPVEPALAASPSHFERGRPIYTTD